MMKRGTSYKGSRRPFDRGGGCTRGKERENCEELAEERGKDNKYRKKARKMCKV